MKIGFIGNVNNYPLIIAKKLRDRGHEIVFIVDEPAHNKLHRPENYLYHITYPYPDWIIEDLHSINLLRACFPKIFAKSILTRLNCCDAVILNGLWHGLATHLNNEIPTVSIFSGADLDVYASYPAFNTFISAHPKTKILPGFLIKKIAKMFVRKHRAGMARACTFSYFPPGLVLNGDALIKEIFSPATLRFNHCHVETDHINYHAPPKNNPLKIINVARFVWKQPLPPGYNMAEAKGNDIMIHGIARFLKETGKPLDIHFIEKGLHVQETKALIKEYGFDQMVTWHKEMGFGDFIEFIATGDIIFEQLSNHVFTGGLYPMLIGRPVIANGRLEIFDKITKTKSPLCQAANATEVTEWLIKLSDNEELRRQAGIKSRQYVQENYDISLEADFFAAELQKHTGATLSKK